MGSSVLREKGGTQDAECVEETHGDQGGWGGSGLAAAGPQPTLPCSLVDINECSQLPTPCTHGCLNLLGSFRCLCPAGFVLLPGGKTCGPLGGELRAQNITTLGSRSLRLRPRGPGGSYHAWVSLRPRPRALGSWGRTCPPGFIQQNGVCTGKTKHHFLQGRRQPKLAGHVGAPTVLL